jgi:DNA-3-methyladenine glycosylase I
MALKPRQRCAWCGDDPLYQAYHDEEWGVPVHDDRLLFEQLILEGAQAGLSWITVLKKRPAYRRAFANFDPAKVARFSPAKIEKLCTGAGIIRHRGKIASTVRNAQVFLKMQKTHGSFATWLWAQVDGKPIHRHRRHPTGHSPLAEKISRELRREGMNFVGPSIMHAFLQAVGVFNEHSLGCYKAKVKAT